MLYGQVSDAQFVIHTKQTLKGLEAVLIDLLVESRESHQIVLKKKNKGVSILNRGS